MQARINILLAVLVLLISGLACAALEPDYAEDDSYATEEPYVTSAPVPGIPSEEAVSCPAITDQIVELNSIFSEEDTAESSDFGARDDDTEINIVTYAVSGDDISDPQYDQVSADLRDEQDDVNTHLELWRYFAALIPPENRELVVEFSIVTDGRDNILASVAQTEADPRQWGLNIDIADTQDYYSLSFTLVHEFAHLLTLGPDQVPPNETVFNNPDDNDIYLEQVSACPNFFPGEGCAKSDSYINAFYDQFWADKYDEWNEINLEEDDDIYYQLLDDFYYKYENQFLTDYAATNPAEDIAESFSFFVFSEEPARNSPAGDKILFFYSYPDLTELRAHIRNNLCESFPQ